MPTNLMISNMAENFKKNMNMKKTPYYIMAAVLCLAACSKSETAAVSEHHSLSADAKIESGTKTLYTDGGVGAGVKVDWAATESFKAYYEGASEPLVFSKSAVGTMFSAEKVPAGVTSNTPLKGLYGSAASLDSDGKIAIDFTKQDGTLEGLAAYDVMTADSELNEDILRFAFRHNCAILRLKLTNHLPKEVDNVVLYFHNSAVDESFSETGITESSIKTLTLSFKLKVPVAKGSSEYGKGTVDYRFAVVPAMQWSKTSNESMRVDDLTGFSEDIELSAKRNIEAGKVYDVECEAGVEEAEGGGFWGD